MGAACGCAVYESVGEKTFLITAILRLDIFAPLFYTSKIASLGIQHFNQIGIPRPVTRTLKIPHNLNVCQRSKTHAKAVVQKGITDFLILYSMQIWLRQ